jgi:hypothetical protein
MRKAVSATKLDDSGGGDRSAELAILSKKI